VEEGKMKYKKDVLSLGGKDNFYIRLPRSEQLFLSPQSTFFARKHLFSIRQISLRST